MRTRQRPIIVRVVAIGTVALVIIAISASLLMQSHTFR